MQQLFLITVALTLVLPTEALVSLLADRTTTTTCIHEKPQRWFKSSTKFQFRNTALPTSQYPCTHRRGLACLRLANSDSDGIDEGAEEEIIESSLAEQDWRTFRAKLVMSESAATTVASSPQGVPEPSSPLFHDDLDGIGSLFQETSTTSSSSSVSDAAPKLFQGMTPLDPSQWAYDSGKVIEQGAVILGGVEQEFGFGLRQQYFHKSAILVLDHEEKTFTKGIILNRPSDLILEDDMNPGVKWRVWFGGDVQGLNSVNPEVVCLHSLRDEQATKASITVMKDIQWTTFENAKRLVRAGTAKPTDFWVFIGYAGWGPAQLMGELDRKSWYMVATDSQTLLKELARLSAGADPREAGLDTWTLLMNMIGRGETAEEYYGDFDDLMLKEWALRFLLSTDAGGGAGNKQISLDSPSMSTTESTKNWFNRLTSPRVEDVVEGSLVRASSADRSPFLLEDQEFHKSVVLIIKDDEDVSIGVILNRPAARGLDIKIQHRSTGDLKSVSLPLRFGGRYAVQGSEPMLWLHCNTNLREANVGSPIGTRKDGIWKCTAEDVIKAIGREVATPEDFMVVTGVCAWSKSSQSQGIQGEVKTGKFEVIPAARTEAVWSNLLKLEVLTTVNLVKNLAMSGDAWSIGAHGKKPTAESTTKSPLSLPLIGGLGEGFDEDDETLVFKSDVKVSKLSDDALRSWVATFLLGAPTLGG